MGLKEIVMPPKDLDPPSIVFPYHCNDATFSTRYSPRVPSQAGWHWNWLLATDSMGARPNLIKMKTLSFFIISPSRYVAAGIINPSSNHISRTYLISTDLLTPQEAQTHHLPQHFGLPVVNRACMQAIVMPVPDESQRPFMSCWYSLPDLAFGSMARFLTDKEVWCIMGVDRSRRQIFGLIVRTVTLRYPPGDEPPTANVKKLMQIDWNCIVMRLLSRLPDVERLVMRD